jgi:hypothetical protein
MIELEEVQMTVTSDDALEAVVVEVRAQARFTNHNWCG